MPLKRLSPWITAFCLMLAPLASCADSPPTRAALEAEGLAPLDGERLRAYLADHTLYFRQWNRPAGTVDLMSVLYRAEGVRYVLFPSLGAMKMSWRIEEDRLCEEDFRSAARAPVCRTLFAKDDGGATCQAGAERCEYRFRRAAGNPERIAE